ncbi:phycobilisome protein [Geitlerinema sp. PCC 7407]|uniref:phycobilisome protein n=1 Tax=Geitlerinema sp. PCC 7407 TaxID=1173025 RepID=UPI001CBC53EC|nr:phycobilisome protein [Geitlerinema sp. PCC 7407]
MERLRQEVDGRYASDEELKFFEEYIQTFPQRLSAYRRIQMTEAILIQQVQRKLRSQDPRLLRSGQQDVSGKWKRDTLRVLRYSALAMLINDPELLQESLLFWMQTVMRAFGAQRSCDVTYRLMQEVAQQHLPRTEAALFCPILELNRSVLGDEAA